MHRCVTAARHPLGLPFLHILKNSLCSLTLGTQSIEGTDGSNSTGILCICKAQGLSFPHPWCLPVPHTGSCYLPPIARVTFLLPIVFSLRFQKPSSNANVQRCQSRQRAQTSLMCIIGSAQTCCRAPYRPMVSASSLGGQPLGHS